MNRFYCIGKYGDWWIDIMRADQDLGERPKMRTFCTLSIIIFLRVMPGYHYDQYGPMSPWKDPFTYRTHWLGSDLDKSYMYIAMWWLCEIQTAQYHNIRLPTPNANDKLINILSTYLKGTHSKKVIGKVDFEASLIQVHNKYLKVLQNSLINQSGHYSPESQQVQYHQIWTCYAHQPCH